MNADQLDDLAAIYREAAEVFAADNRVGPTLAHGEAATLLHKAAAAMRMADGACATLQWCGFDRAAGADILAVYEPASGTVAVMQDGQLINFAEAEAEAIHAAFGDALATRALGRSLVDQAGRAA